VKGKQFVAEFLQRGVAAVQRAMLPRSMLIGIRPGGTAQGAYNTSQAARMNPRGWAFVVAASN